MTTSYFALELLLVIILAGPVHQESTERPFEGPFCYTFTRQKIISAPKSGKPMGLCTDHLRKHVVGFENATDFDCHGIVWEFTWRETVMGDRGWS